jgi:hypothetical protein
VPLGRLYLKLIHIRLKGGGGFKIIKNDGTKVHYHSSYIEISKFLSLTNRNLDNMPFKYLTIFYFSLIKKKNNI